MWTCDLIRIHDRRAARSLCTTPSATSRLRPTSPLRSRPPGTTYDRAEPRSSSRTTCERTTSTTPTTGVTTLPTRAIPAPSATCSGRTDPDPDDTWYLDDFAYLLREPDGSTRVASDRHTLGLLPRATWFELLAEVGFVNARTVASAYEEEEVVGTEGFLARRPA